MLVGTLVRHFRVIREQWVGFLLLVLDQAVGATVALPLFFPEEMLRGCQRLDFLRVEAGRVRCVRPDVLVQNAVSLLRYNDIFRHG